jgi:hypothetical protein
MNKKKMTIGVIVGVYIALVICASLFVPVIASIGTEDPDMVYGYYPLWEVSQSSHSSPGPAEELPITVKINITAWIIQYVFLTLVFVSLLLRTLKHFREREICT